MNLFVNSILKRSLFVLVCLFLLSAITASGQSTYDYGDYEVYSLGNSAPVKRKAEKELFKVSPRNGLNADGLGGLFVAESADKLEPKQLILGFRYKYHGLTSTKGTSFRYTEDGHASTYEASLNWVGRWGEWSATVPIHNWSLNTPRTMPKQSGENTGLGNMRLGFKATYMPDRSYYRFAYGTVITTTTGNPQSMLPAGVKDSDEIKLYGCVTTSETDKATANLELGAVINSDSYQNRFLYRLGLSYDAAKYVAVIGEFVGEVIGGDDQDTLDMVMGVRLAPSDKFTLELVYYKNLRTYRDFGWDDQFQIGSTIKW